jgi:hypothetical protein
MLYEWHGNVIPEDPNWTVANRKKIVIYNVGISRLWTVAFPLEGASVCFTSVLGILGVRRRQVYTLTLTHTPHKTNQMSVKSPHPFVRQMSETLQRQVSDYMYKVCDISYHGL